jgi:tRNA (uracil-5-)-methyltransferase
MNKFIKATSLISNHYKDTIKINLSPPYGYRSRCEFGYRDGFYTMYDSSGNIRHLEVFYVARPIIQNLMPKLRNSINSSKFLNHKLFQVNFRTNSDDSILVTLIFHKKLDDDIKAEAQKLSNEFEIAINIRSRKDIYSTGNDLLADKLNINNILLYQTDQSFYQPNHFHMPKMVMKTISFLENTQDLLELYCGSGTFTLPLSYKFNKVFATESNRQSIKCLSKSIEELSIPNIDFARLSAEEVSEAFNGRVFRRMNRSNINTYNFSHVLVDPPRSGLNDEVIDIIKKFKNIIYISCNYETYARDINKLNGFAIKHIEIFDQFPNTEHLEVVSLLSKQ